MRISVLAAIAVAGLLPNPASASGPTDRDRTTSARDVRVSRAAQAGTTWAPARAKGMREEYRRPAPLYADEGFSAEGYPDDRYPDDRYPDDRYGNDDYGRADAYGVDEHARSDRFVRDDDGRLDYDRDYPYDYSYGNHGGGYTIVETTTTTEPSVVERTVYDQVAVHRPKRYRKTHRAYRTSSRAHAKSCRCK